MTIEGERLRREKDGKELIGCYDLSKPRGSACKCGVCKLIQNSKECKQFVSETSSALMWR
jgi:hypothetical protein